MNFKTILFTLLVAIAFIGTSMLALVTAKNSTATQNARADASDFSMTNATYTKYDEQGNIHKKLFAKKITHLTQNNMYLFNQPDMTIYVADEQPWQITATNGKSEQGQEIIHLWDNVKILRAIGPRNSDFDIATTALDIYPNKKFAETDQPTTIIQNGNITKSVGAIADFKTGNVKLLSQIEALYLVK